MSLYFRAMVGWCIAGMFGLTVHAQDVGFSQFYDQPLLRNPALAGIFTGDIRLVGAFRNQWQSVTVPYRTYGLSAEVRFPTNIIPDDYITAGLQVMKDVAGTSEFSTTQILPALNYSIPVGGGPNSYLSLGFMGGLLQQRFDPTKLVLDDQFVAGSNGSFSVMPASAQTFTNTSVNCFDLSLGISYNGSWDDNLDYFVGTGLFHVTKPKVGFLDGNAIVLNKKMAFNAGVSIATSETDEVVLYGDYFKQYGEHFRPVGISTLQVGAFFKRDLVVVDDDRTSFSFGLLYRWDDAVIPVAKFEVSKIAVGVSYDFNISKLVAASHYQGGLEVTVSYRDFLNIRNIVAGHMKCPKFGGHLPNEYYIGY